MIIRYECPRDGEEPRVELIDHDHYIYITIPDSVTRLSVLAKSTYEDGWNGDTEVCEVVRPSWVEANKKTWVVFSSGKPWLESSPEDDPMIVVED
jgi:hypothetical protein